MENNANINAEKTYTEMMRQIVESAKDEMFVAMLRSMGLDEKACNFLKKLLANGC